MLKRLGGLVGLVPGADPKKMLEKMTIADVIDAHMKWKISLQEYLDGQAPLVLDPVQARRDELSVTGQWIRLQADGEIGGYNAFFTVRAKHAQCHMLAGDLMEKLLAGDHAGAQELMNSRLLKISHELVYALVDLDRQVTAAG